MEAEKEEEKKKKRKNKKKASTFGKSFISSELSNWL